MREKPYMTLTWYSDTSEVSCAYFINLNYNLIINRIYEKMQHAVV